MKKHQLILFCTAAFVILFYDEDLGLNFGILGLIYSALTYFQTKRRNQTRIFFALLAATVISSCAFAWFGDIPSFFALVFSSLLLIFKSKNRSMKPLLLLPVFVVNGFTFICRFFKFEQWIPKTNTGKSLQKMIAFILIPAFFLIVFFLVYAQGSDHFAGLFSNYELDFNLWQFVVLSCLGFFLAFNFWNFAVEKYLYKQNSLLNNDFREGEKVIKPTYDFLDLDFERNGGVVTFILLNILLVFFIVTYNYEQFYTVSKAPNQLSADTHERVNAVILSIVMAVCVIMFYFKSTFNFDEKSGLLKVVAKIWIGLNAVLVLSAMAKNAEYVAELGITYKRIGVFAFLFLSLVGLFHSFLKIKNKKTNAYLFNTMFWYFYGTLLLSSFVNWGNLATVYNINHQKGDLNFLRSLNFNHKILMEKFPAQTDDYNLYEIEREQSQTFLSKKLYYQFIETKQK